VLLIGPGDGYFKCRPGAFFIPATAETRATLVGTWRNQPCTGMMGFVPEVVVQDAAKIGLVTDEGLGA
jgi:hypothetical protein|tara:strand:+ start:311 stop:514 length:204 start_codon:yes stop_codon:yes gene_type:complete